VNFDGVYSDEFQGRLGQATKGLDSDLDGVLQEINGLARQMEGAGEMTSSFGGVTASPYLRGLYADGKVYTNPLEVLYQHVDDMESAAKDLVGNLIHEAFHNMTLEHSGRFHSMVDELAFLSRADEKFQGWTARVQKALEARREALDGLMPEYRREIKRAGSIGRESWRGEAGVRKPASVDATRRAARESYQQVARAEDLEARGSPGLQRGEALPTGRGRQAGPLGEAAADRGVDARAALEDAGIPARGEGEGRGIAAEETGRGNGEGVGSVEEAYRIIDGLVKEGTKESTLAGRSVQLAFEIAHRIGRTADGQDRLAELATGKPARGEYWSRWNLDQMAGFTDESKAAITLWSQITEQHPELRRMFKADKVRGWDQLDTEVKAMLDARSKKDLYRMLGKGRKGLTDTEVVLVKILGADLLNQVEARSADLADSQLKLAEGRGSLAEVQAAEASMRVASENFAHNMPSLINPLTETARALAAARKVARAQSPEAAMLQDMRGSLFERLRTKYERNDAQRVTDELMSLWAAVRSGAVNPETGLRYTPRDWAEAYRNAYRFGKFDQFLEAYKAFLLGWKSRVANIASNTLVQGVRELERTVATGMEKVAAKLQGRQAERYFGELKLNSAIMKHWATSALPDWYQAMKDGFLLKPDDVTLDHVGSMMEDLSHQVGAIKGKPGEFVRFMFKGMNAEDALFKRMSQLQHYYKTVYRNIRQGKEGYSMRPGEDAYAATARYVDEIEETWLKKMKGQETDKALLKKYAEIHDEGFRIAREETFQTELPEFMKAFQNALRKPGGKPFQMIFPFVRTPYNIAVETLRRTPAGFLEVAQKWDRLSGPERMDALARPMVGTAVGMVLVNEAMNGNLTGGGPLDPIDEANLRETGWRAYSLKVGDQYLSYQRLEPISSVMGMAADIAEGVKRGDFDTVQRATTRLFSLVTENLTNKTFLSGLEGLSTAMSDPQRYAGQWIKQMQMSIVPNTIGPIPFGHLAQTVDPVYRQTEPMSREVFMTKVPFLSRTLAPQYTPTGETRMRPGTAVERLLSPMVRTTQRTDPTALAAALLDQIGSPPTPPKKYTFIRGVKVYYTPEQRKMLAQAQSQATQLIGTRLVRDPNFMRLPDNEDVAPLGAKTKKQVIKKIYDRYRRNTAARFRGDLMQKARVHEGGEAR
jgi:hypothetical protein